MSILFNLFFILWSYMFKSTFSAKSNGNKCIFVLIIRKNNIFCTF